MNQSFKLTSKTKIKSLKGLFHSLIMLIAAIAFFYFLFEESIYVPLFVLVVMFFLFYILPVIVLYNNYLKYAKNIEVILQQNTMAINGKTYTSEDIELIEIYTTMQHAKKRASMHTFSHNEYFYYIAVDVKDGHTIVLNSLMGQNIDEEIKNAFPDVEIKHTFSLFSRLMITENSFSKNRV